MIMFIDLLRSENENTLGKLATYIYIKVLDLEPEYITSTDIFLLSRSLFNCFISLIVHLYTKTKNNELI